MCLVSVLSPLLGFFLLPNCLGGGEMKSKYTFEEWVSISVAGIAMLSVAAVLVLFGLAMVNII